mmetsp:Transcript_78630/g.255251  ORF Transcript_78630/g.255251 Transcript_78630/m.255251 type:complete len:126 (-) Transcript_78630:180-557(-)
MTGTMPFMAPEVLVAANKDYYDPSGCDVWSAGVVLLEMLCGPNKLGKMLGWTPAHDPCPERSRELHNFFSDERLLRESLESYLGEVSGHLLALLSGMLAVEVAPRWSMAKVLDSEWLASGSALSA